MALKLADVSSDNVALGSRPIVSTFRKSHMGYMCVSVCELTLRRSFRNYGSSNYLLLGCSELMFAHKHTIGYFFFQVSARERNMRDLILIEKQTAMRDRNTAPIYARYMCMYVSRRELSRRSLAVHISTLVYTLDDCHLRLRASREIRSRARAVDNYTEFPNYDF